MANTLVAGDAGTIVNAYIYDSDTSGRVDLNGCSVKFQMRRISDRRLMIDEAATILVPASGTVSFVLEAPDMTRAGNYVIEWQVTFPDGSKQTTATLHDVTIRRR